MFAQAESQRTAAVALWGGRSDTGRLIGTIRGLPWVFDDDHLRLADLDAAFGRGRLAVAKQANGQAPGEVNP